MSRLCVIDVSAVVHTGVYSPTYANRTAFGYPNGGINFFMSQLMIPLYEMDDIILCFDSPNFRRKLSPGYKSGRNHSSVAISNIEALYTYLSYCGFSCYKFDGYEADDIIDWVIEKFWRKYSQVLIVGNDKDLAHSVRPNVCFRACRSDMNIISRVSFPNAVFKDVYLPYNMTSVYKCLCGCPSDTVPVFRLENGKSGKELYNDAVQFYEEHDLVNDYYKSTNIGVFKVWARNYGFTETDMENLETRIKLIFPAAYPFGDVADADFEPVSRFTIDLAKLSRVLTMFNVYEAFKGKDVYRVQLTDEDKQEVYKLAKQFNSGVFNADKNLPMNSDRITAEPLTIDAFEKDF